MTRRAIFWDMDGTLIDSEPAHQAAFNDAVAHLGLTVSPSVHSDLVGSSGDRIHAALVAATGLNLSFAEWTELKHGFYIAHAQAILRREPSSSIAIRLAAQGVPQAVVSNSTAAEVALCLSLTGLDQIITTTISRADVAQGKPAPEIYLLAAQRYGINPADCLVVEDSVTGARAGVAAGMSVIYHPQHAGTTAPDGAVYLAHDADPAPLIDGFLARGSIGL